MDSLEATRRGPGSRGLTFLTKKKPESLTRPNASNETVGCFWMGVGRMSRKDYRGIADNLRTRRPNELWRVFASARDVRDRQALIEQWKDDVNAVAEYCMSDNPRFDLDRFKEACGWYD
jgi:hypothetical protein